MKSDLINKAPHCTSSTFPALFQRLNTDMVVLFLSMDSGVVVYEGRDVYFTGDYGTRFIPCNDQKVWQRLPSGSQVILTQE